MKTLVVSSKSSNIDGVEALIKKAFGSQDIYLKGAVSTEAAVACLEKDWFDCCFVVIDDASENGTPSAVLQELRKREIGVPVVYLVDEKAEQLGLEAVKDGADTYLVKQDLRSDLLYQTISAVVERHRREIAFGEMLQALDKSEERFNALIKSVHVGIMLVDWGGHVEGLNEAMERMTGFAQADAKSFDDFSVLLFPISEERALLAEKLNHLHKAGGKERSLITLRTKYGARRRVMMRAAPVARPDKTLILCALYELTGEQEIQEAIGSANIQTEQLLQAVTSILIGIDPEGVVTHWNRVAQKVFSIPAEQVLGRAFSQCGIGWDPKPLITAIDQARTSGKAVRLDDHKFKRSESDEGYLGFSINPMSDHKGKYTGVLLFGADITQRKRSELQLKLAEQRYKLIFDNSAVAIMATDQAQSVVSWNRFAEEMIGMGNEEMYFKPLAELFPDEEWTRINSEMDQNEEIRDYVETRIVKANGDVRDVDLAITVLRDLDGNVMSWVAIMKDITDQKHLQRLKDEFIGMVSHELRTPLTVVREGVAQLSEGILGDLNETQKEFVDIALKEMDRLTAIVNDLLDISKIESGRVELNKRFIDVAELMRPIEMRYRRMADTKNIDFKVEQPEAGTKIYCDDEKVTQILLNLLQNAYKFTGDKGTITVAISQKEEWMEFRVIDNGKGVAKDELSKLFDKFHQVGRTIGPGPRGTGLGLAICKALVDLHNGRISVDSDEGNGSVFTFLIPRLDGKTVLEEHVDQAIVRAQKKNMGLKMCLLALSVFGVHADPRVFEMGRRLQKYFRRNMVKAYNEILLLDDGNVAVLAEIADHQEGEAIETNVRNALKTFAKKEKELETVDISFKLGTSSFPEDGLSTGELMLKLEKAVEEMA